MTLVDCKSVYTDAPGLRPEVSRRAKMSEVSECFNIDTGFLLFVLYFVPNIAGWYYLQTTARIQSNTTESVTCRSRTVGRAAKMQTQNEIDDLTMQIKVFV